MKMPAIGFGCSPFRGEARVDLEPAVREALATGYRLFDVAELYGNETAIGRALHSEAAPSRGELFVVGKVWRTNYRPQALRRACEASLRRLGLDAFDLYLLHAPDAWQHAAPLDDADRIGWEELERRAVPRDARGALMTDAVAWSETWEAMQELVRAGLTAGVGVSNFDTRQLAELEPAPAANQIAVSPAEPDRQTIEWCRERGIAVLGHSPLSGAIRGGDALDAICASTGRTVPQVILRWLIQRGVTPLPSSTSGAHIRENFASLDFALDREQMLAIDAMQAGPAPLASPN
jgi:diketogulonate reductase-like aldo/keto reductase